ncbi:MAG: helix-turn-helix domain-containing protein [Bacteroidia bacterium]
MSRGHSDFRGVKHTRTTDVYTSTVYEVNGLSFALIHYKKENHIPFYRSNLPPYCGTICYVLKGIYSVTAQGQLFNCKEGDMLFIRDCNAYYEKAMPGTQLFSFPVCAGMCSAYGVELAQLPPHAISSNMPLYLYVKTIYRHFKFNTAWSHIDMDGEYRHLVAALVCKLYQPKALKHNLAAMAAELLNAGLNDTRLRDQLAEKTGLHPNSVSRAFKEAHGISLKKFSFQKRVEQGAALLKTSKEPVSVISDICGFSTASQFSNAIKNHTGYSPGKWRVQA